MDKLESNTSIQRLITNYQNGMYQLHECLSEILLCLCSGDLEKGFDSLSPFWKENLVKLIENAPATVEDWLSRPVFSLESWAGPMESIEATKRTRQLQLFEGIVRLRKHLNHLSERNRGSG